MNVAAFIVAAMNIPHIIECSSPDSATFDIFFLSVSHLVFDFVHKFCCVTAHHEFFGICLFLVIQCLRFFPIHSESSLRTLRNAHFRREEVLHDEGQLFATYPKKFSQVSPIDRHLQQIFQDLDIHTRSFPGFNEVEEDTTEGILAVKFIIGLDLAVTCSSPDPC